MIPEILAQFLQDNGIPTRLVANPGINLTDLYIKEDPTLRLTVCHIVPTEAHMVYHHVAQTTRILYTYDLNHPHVFDQLLNDIRKHL